MKKSLTKIICLILALCVSFGIICVSAEDTASNNVSEKMDVLRLFGLIPDYYDFNTSFDENVSRADFADVVARLIDTSEYGGDEVHYYDVLKSHYAYNSISALTELGVINGTGDKFFKPDLPMSTAGAYKILVCLLGYGDIALRSGGYPAGYIDIARKIDIYEGLSGENLTRGEMINMLYNALNTKILSSIGYSNDGKLVISESEETLLSMYHDIYYGEGVVNGANGVSVNEYNLSESNMVLIDNEVYISEIEVIENLGQKIEFYWLENSKENKKELLWVKVKNTKDMLNLEIDENASFDSNTFVYTYYTENGNERQINLERGATLVYNGRVVESGFGKILNKDRYSVKFVKTNNAYNFVIVNAYENYIVDLFDSTKGIVYDKTGEKDALILNENTLDYLIVRNPDGSKAEISSIKKGDVLSVFESLDGKYKEVIIGTEIRGGVITGISKKNDKYTIKFQDGTYYMPRKMFEKNPEKVKAGDSVKLYIDYSGIVAMIEVQTDKESAAYIIDVATVEDGFEEKIMLKLLMQDGSISTLACDKTVNLDGKKKAVANDIKAKFIMSDGKIDRQLILVKVNADDVIKKIDTAEVKEINGETKGNSLWKRVDAKEQRFVNDGFFGGVSVMDNKSVMFRIPVSDDEVEDEKNYDVITRNDLINHTNYNIATYNTSERVGCDKYVVVKMDSNLDNGKINTVLPILVKNIGTVLNSDGDIVECVEGLQGNTEVTFLSDGDYSFEDDGIKVGMLIQLSTTKDSKVGDTEIIFDPEAEFVSQSGISGVSTYMKNVGYIHDIVDSVMKIGFSSGANVDYVAMEGNAAVLVYDSNDERNRVHTGSFADAKRYYNVESDIECSKVVVISRYFVPSLYVIYN